MTIEKSPAAASSHKNTAHGSHHGAKAKASSADAAADSVGAKAGNGGTGGAEGGAGFQSILGALDDASANVVAPPVLAEDVLPADAAAAASAALPLDINALLQQSSQTAATDAALATPATAAQALPLAAPLATPLATPLTATATEAGALPGRPAPAAAGQRQATSARAAPDAAADTAALMPGAAATAASTVALQHAQAQAHARAGRDDLQAGANGAANANHQSVASERAEQGKFMAAMEQARATPEAVRTLEPLLAPLVGRTEKALAERNAAGIKGTEPGYAGAAMGAALGVGNSPDFSLSTVQAPGVVPEMQVAEQVSYWVSQNVQNAELKLDGLGQSPVEVSISMQGNAAQIAFRTDELATREMLERAGHHLKELLQSEGLVLSGVSVGNSGSGQPDGRERGARQNVRQTAIAPLQTAGADGNARLRTLASSGAGQAVDLFV